MDDVTSDALATMKAANPKAQQQNHVTRQELTIAMVVLGIGCT